MLSLFSDKLHCTRKGIENTQPHYIYLDRLGNYTMKTDRGAMIVREDSMQVFNPNRGTRTGFIMNLESSARLIE